MREIGDAGDRGLISLIEESAGTEMARRSTKVREIQRHDASRQEAREIQKARLFQRRGEGQQKARVIQKARKIPAQCQRSSFPPFFFHPGWLSIERAAKYLPTFSAPALPSLH